MQRPEKFHIRNRQTNEWRTQDYEPYYEMNNNNYDVFIDTRYEARLRLYKYWQRINGIKEFKYDPYKGTEIGKSLPILNF